MKKMVILVFSFLSSMMLFGQELTVKSFSEKGVLVDVQKFFKDAKADEAGNEKKLLTSYVALVTEKGVFSFLERGENETFLKAVKVGDQVEIKGKLLEAGSLVEIESLEPLKAKIEIDLSVYQTKEGQSVNLEGVNKCQCGLKVGELSHSCKLGHLHHLQTADGKIYHYLESGKSADMKMHFKKMKVDVLLFPGNFIKIKEVADK